MTIINTITVRVGKKVPIEGMQFSSRDYGIEVAAELAPGEDVAKAFAELRAMAEGLVDGACGISKPTMTEAERLRAATKDPAVKDIVKKFEGDIVKAEPEEVAARREAQELAKRAAQKVGAAKVKEVIKAHGAAMILDVPADNIIKLRDALMAMCDD